MTTYTLRIDKTDEGWAASVKTRGGFFALIPDAEASDISSTLENVARLLESVERFLELPEDVQKRLPGWGVVSHK